MPSSGLTRGSLFYDEIPRSSRGMTQDLGNSRFILRNSRFALSFGLCGSGGKKLGNSKFFVMRSPSFGL